MGPLQPSSLPTLSPVPWGLQGRCPLGPPRGLCSRQKPPPEHSLCSRSRGPGQPRSPRGPALRGHSCPTAICIPQTHINHLPCEQGGASLSSVLAPWDLRMLFCRKGCLPSHVGFLEQTKIAQGLYI